MEDFPPMPAKVGERAVAGDALQGLRLHEPCQAGQDARENQCPGSHGRGEGGVGAVAGGAAGRGARVTPTSLPASACSTFRLSARSSRQRRWDWRWFGCRIVGIAELTSHQQPAKSRDFRQHLRIFSLGFATERHRGGNMLTTTLRDTLHQKRTQV